jgi:hypothetical protein
VHTHLRVWLQTPPTQSRLSRTLPVRPFPPIHAHARAHARTLFGAGECYDSLTVSGAEAVQAAAMGTFTKFANLTQGDRPVYNQVTAAPTAPPLLYLFYWPSTSEWLIGSNYTSTSNASVQSAGIAALCPDQVPEIGWEVYNGTAWVSTYPIQFVRTGDTQPPRVHMQRSVQKPRKTTARHCTAVPETS